MLLAPMLLSTNKINATLYRLCGIFSGRQQFYEYRITVHYGKGEFGAAWDSSGHPVIKAGLEMGLYQWLYDDLRTVMLKTAENLEEEARKIRQSYP